MCVIEYDAALFSIDNEDIMAWDENEANEFFIVSISDWWTVLLVSI